MIRTHSARFSWTRDRPIADASTERHTTSTFTPRSLSRFETVIPASEHPQTYALNRAANKIGSQSSGTSYLTTLNTNGSPSFSRPIQEAYCWVINPYPTAFPYGNGMVLHFCQQQESSTTKTVHKVINKRLKTYV